MAKDMWPEYAVLDGAFYFHWWGAGRLDSGGSYWHLRRKENAGGLMVPKTDVVENIFKQAGVRDAKMTHESCKIYIEVRMAGGQPHDARVRAFTQLAMLMPE